MERKTRYVVVRRGVAWGVYVDGPFGYGLDCGSYRTRREARNEAWGRRAWDVMGEANEVRLDAQETAAAGKAGG